MVFAHQGGWDEMLMVLGPILAIVLLLRLAKKRAERSAVAVDDSAAAPVDDRGADGDD
jgi:hypothetical protein